MRCNRAGIDLIKNSEGFRPKPYRSIEGGTPTIGYGHKMSLKEMCLPRFWKGLSEPEAYDLLLQDIQRIENSIYPYVHVALNENQWAAIVSLAFNIGPNAFNRSTLLKLLNAKMFTQAAQQFRRWVFSGTKRLAGLVIRRQKEMDLFNKSV